MLLEIAPATTCLSMQYSYDVTTAISFVEWNCYRICIYRHTYVCTVCVQTHTHTHTQIDRRRSRFSASNIYAPHLRVFRREFPPSRLVFEFRASLKRKDISTLPRRVTNATTRREFLILDEKWRIKFEERKREGTLTLLVFSSFTFGHWMEESVHISLSAIFSAG